ncbi:Uncharacterised protein [Mycobacteroides abscessus]|nr:Uncharacterised protein [Mycobacteroides abscessus]CPZ61610.1 Uncharacterised protein [Mycobacteroides abscessus]
MVAGELRHDRGDVLPNGLFTVQAAHHVFDVQSILGVHLGVWVPIAGFDAAMDGGLVLRERFFELGAGKGWHAQRLP